MATLRADLGEDLIERIAHRVVELLREEEILEQRPRYVDAATLARHLGVEREWIYANKERLGGFRLGGPKGRLRFDREAVMERLGLSDHPQPRRRRSGAKRKPRNVRQQRTAEVKSPQIQRRASGRTPARSPKRHHTGGSPE